jgi:hypothetical protein
MRTQARNTAWHRADKVPTPPRACAARRGSLAPRRAKAKADPVTAAPACARRSRAACRAPARTPAAPCASGTADGWVCARATRVSAGSAFSSTPPPPTSCLSRYAAPRPSPLAPRPSLLTPRPRAGRAAHSFSRRTRRNPPAHLLLVQVRRTAALVGLQLLLHRGVAGLVVLPVHLGLVEHVDLQGGGGWGGWGVGWGWDWHIEGGAQRRRRRRPANLVLDPTLKSDHGPATPAAAAPAAASPAAPSSSSRSLGGTCPAPCRARPPFAPPSAPPCCPPRPAA